jgi:dephospho-CoA kinase
VRRVIALQASREQRRALADAVVFNDGLTPAALADEVARLWACWITTVEA